MTRIVAALAAVALSQMVTPAGAQQTELTPGTWYHTCARTASIPAQACYFQIRNADGTGLEMYAASFLAQRVPIAPDGAPELTSGIEYFGRHVYPDRAPDPWVLMRFTRYGHVVQNSPQPDTFSPTQLEWYRGLP